MPNAVVITIDGLHAGIVGCYGNSWVATPTWNRLAAQGIVFDQALVDSVDVRDTANAIWRATPSFLPSHLVSNRPLLPELLMHAGVTSMLVTDSADIVRHPVASSFAQRVHLEPPGTQAVAESTGQTWLASCFAEAIAQLEQSEGPFLLWLHLAGWCRYWDAPLALREQYADEEDPLPWSSTEPLIRQLERGEEPFDPDLRLRLRFAYAAQVTVLDACLDAFVTGLESTRASDETLLAWCGTRGWPLGEHRQMGLVADRDLALHNELVQMPLVIRLPDEQGAATRSQALVQPADLGATLFEWFGVPWPWHESPVTAASLLPIASGDRQQNRWWACVHGTSERWAFRTPAWYLLHGSEDRCETYCPTDMPLRDQLFAKPDDRWEMNEVADRVPEIAKAMSETLDACRAAAARGRLDELHPADEQILESAE